MSEVVTVWQDEQDGIDRFQGVMVYARVRVSHIWNGFHKRVSAESGFNSTDVHRTIVNLGQADRG